MERWKEVTWLNGYRGVLAVSDQARVRRHSYQYECLCRWGTVITTTKPDQILSSYVEKNGYATVGVQLARKRKKFQLHYLVARAFVPGYAVGLCVNHIDGNKANNLPHNLEWVTRGRNTQHAWETGLVDIRGDKHPSRKLHSGQVRIIRRLLSIGASSCELATLCKVSDSTILMIKDGQRWNAVR